MYVYKLAKWHGGASLLKASLLIIVDCEGLNFASPTISPAHA